MWNGFGANTLPLEEARRDELRFQRLACARPIPSLQAGYVVWIVAVLPAVRRHRAVRFRVPATELRSDVMRKRPSNLSGLASPFHCAADESHEYAHR